MKKILTKYKHIIFALYLPIYLAGFAYLEKTVTEFTPLNSPVDDLIPFIGIFIIPYIAWFFYVGVSCVYFFLKSQREFMMLMSFLMVGMTAYLIICWIFPNGLHDFRPAALDENSVFTGMISWLYNTDTSTNVFPSIHVYNSIGVHTAIARSNKITRSWIKKASLVLCILICLSTMFLKQHAIIDVIGGCVMSVMVYHLVYRTRYSSFIERKTWD